MKNINIHKLLVKQDKKKYIYHVQYYEWANVTCKL